MKFPINSIKNKFIVAILIASFIPFGLSIFYVFTEVKKQIAQQIINYQKNYIESVRRKIAKDFSSLNSNIKLWSSNQILEDILVDDIDKRIQKYILNISKTFKGEIIITNSKGKVISSSITKLLGKKLSILYTKEHFTDLHSIKGINGFYIKISQPILSSVSKENIGYFLVLLKPAFFNEYTVSNDFLTLSIFHKKKSLFIGKKLFVGKNWEKEGIYESPEFISLYTQINKSFLKNWLIILEIDKRYLFAPIKKIEYTFNIIFLVGSTLILLISLFLSKRLVRPIEELTNLTVEISETKDYQKRAKVLSSDELGMLAKSFNQMLTEIQKAHDQIQRENIERLKLFTALIEMINKMSSLKKEEEIVFVVISELKKFLGAKEVKFTQQKDKSGFYIKIEGGSLQGYIYVDLDREVNIEEKKFLESIGKMVSLYLQNIDLLKKSLEASRAKTIFLSNMSHELKTPLNSIIGFAQLLKLLKKEDKDILKIADSIEISGKHLLELINEILELIKVESKAVRVKKERFNLKKLVDEVITIIDPLVKEKGLKLIVDVPSDLVINTDYRMLKQILLNILSNGVKFTDEGYIHLQITEREDRVLFRIKDTGIGINKEDIKKLFSYFVRLEHTLNRHEGTGLGLAISKNYAKLLGGDIKAYSEGRGKGSTFEVYIPKA